MSRKYARETAMKLIYELEISKNDPLETMDSFFKNHNMDKKDREYISDIILGVVENLDRIDKVIGTHSQKWEKNRLAKIDLSILRISIYEIFYRDDIPDSVSINEAVEIAKKYSTDKSPTYINGLLGNVIKIKQGVN